MPIRRLDPLLVDRIAAGAAIERPAAAAKKSIENALNAGAASIGIAIEAGGRRPIGILALAVALALCPTASQALPAPANTLHELFAQLDGCLTSRGVGGAEGSELTVVFSLRRDGALLGKPKITFAHLSGDPGAQRDFARGIASAFDRCLPARITDSLGGAIAGRPLSMRFVIRTPADRT